MRRAFNPCHLFTTYHKVAGGVASSLGEQRGSVSKIVMAKQFCNEQWWSRRNNKDGKAITGMVRVHVYICCQGGQQNLGGLVVD